MKKNHSMIRWQALAAFLLTLAALVLSGVVQQKEDWLYMLIDTDGVQFFSNETQLTLRTPALSVSADGVKEARVLLRPDRYITVDRQEKQEGILCRQERIVQLLEKAGESATLDLPDANNRMLTREETVVHLLKRLDLCPGEGEMVVLDFTGEELRITVTEEAYTYHTVDVPTDFLTERVANPLLAKNTEKVVQEGKPGCMIETYRDTYRGGALAGTDFLGRTPDDAVTEIIEYGLRVNSVSDSDRIKEEHPNEDGSGYLLFASGDTMTYRRKLTCNSTAYYGGTSTATGYPTGYGVIAVDPKVIPYGTKMWIQTENGRRIYGMAVARDCGNFRGNVVDLWFPTYNDCRSWGRRNVTVYILG